MCECCHLNLYVHVILGGHCSVFIKGAWLSAQVGSSSWVYPKGPIRKEPRFWQMPSRWVGAVGARRWFLIDQKRTIFLLLLIMWYLSYRNRICSNTFEVIHLIQREFIPIINLWPWSHKGMNLYSNHKLKMLVRSQFKRMKNDQLQCIKSRFSADRFSWALSSHVLSLQVVGRKPL